MVLDSLERATERVIVVFSEALRLSSLNKMVIKALEGVEFSIPLPQGLWDLVRFWGKISERVLTLWKKWNFAPNTALPAEDRYRSHGFNILDDLIGEEGEMLSCKLHLTKVTSEKYEEKLRGQHAATHFPDPTFEEEDDHQVAGGGRGRGRGGRGRGRGRG